MSEFSQFEDFSLVPGTRKLYQLDKPVDWDIGRSQSGWKLHLNPGATFDISVPRIFEWLVDPHDKRILLAALVHDELLRDGHDAAFSSAEFRRAAIARHVHWLTAWLLFFATLAWTAFLIRVND